METLHILLISFLVLRFLGYVLCRIQESLNFVLQKGQEYLLTGFMNTTDACFFTIKSTLNLNFYQIEKWHKQCLSVGLKKGFWLKFEVCISVSLCLFLPHLFPLLLIVSVFVSLCRSTFEVVVDHDTCITKTQNLCDCKMYEICVTFMKFIWVHRNLNIT